MDRFKWYAVEKTVDHCALECNGTTIMTAGPDGYDALASLAAAHNAHLEQSHEFVNQLDGVVR